MKALTKAYGLAGVIGLAGLSPLFATPYQLYDHWYEVVWSPGISWADANQAANSASYMGLEGHLVTITSAGENLFVRNLIPHVGEEGYDQRTEYWAGGYQSSNYFGPDAPPPWLWEATTLAASGWHWVTGEAWTYANWSAGEPNDAYGAYSEEWLGVGWSREGKWNDEGNAYYINGYIVEYQERTPDGGLTAGLLIAALGGLAAVRRKHEINPR